MCHLLHHCSDNLFDNSSWPQHTQYSHLFIGIFLNYTVICPDEIVSRDWKCVRMWKYETSAILWFDHQTETDQGIKVTSECWTLHPVTLLGLFMLKQLQHIPFDFCSEQRRQEDKWRGWGWGVGGVYGYCRCGVFSSCAASVSASPPPSLLSIFRAFSPLQRGWRSPTAQATHGQDFRGSSTHGQNRPNRFIWFV